MCPPSTHTTDVASVGQTNGYSFQSEAPPSPTVTDGRTCPNCESVVKTIDTSEGVCRDCQTVITAQPLSTAPKPTYGDTHSESAHTGSRVTLLYADQGLGAGVDTSVTTDTNGTPLSPSQQRVCNDTGWTKQLRPREYRLDSALSELRRLGAALNVPTAELESAARLYRIAHKKGHVQGRSVDGFIAACLLVAVRQSSLSLPVSVREIESASPATRDQVRTARGVLTLHLDVEIPPIDPQAFVPQAVSKLSESHRVERCAMRLLTARQSDVDATESISPRTLAAAALHAAFSLVTPKARPTLDEIEAVIDVSASTISERKSELLQYREVWEASTER